MPEFIKAEKRLPNPMVRIFFKYRKDNQIIERYVGYMTNDEWFKGGWDNDAGDFLTFDKKNIEWLDEGGHATK
jgi:hypothetical protein